MKVYLNTINICGGNVSCYRLVTVFNRFGWWITRIKHQKDEVTCLTDIENLERYFLEVELCDSNHDEGSAN